MLAKRFMFVCIGCLALVLAFEFGATEARSQGTGFRTLGTSFVAIGSSVYFLERTNFPVGWKLMPYGGWTLPPVDPASLVQYESGLVAITNTGEGWGLVGGTWTDLGSIPGTPTVRTSWGAVKSKYVH